MSKQFQVGDKVQFEALNPRSKGQIRTGTVVDSGYESVGDGGPKRFGYWLDTGKESGDWIWMLPETLTKAA